MLYYVMLCYIGPHPARRDLPEAPRVHRGLQRRPARGQHAHAPGTTTTTTNNNDNSNDNNNDKHNDDSNNDSNSDSTILHNHNTNNTTNSTGRQALRRRGVPGAAARHVEVLSSTYS